MGTRSNFSPANETIARFAALLAIGILQVWETYTLGQPNVPWRAPEEASGAEYQSFTAGRRITGTLGPRMVKCCI